MYEVGIGITIAIVAITKLLLHIIGGDIMISRYSDSTNKHLIIGKLHIYIGRLDNDFPYRIKILWNRGAGYIGGFTIHIRLQPLTAYCKHQYKYLRKAYLTPIIGITTNGNKWVI